MYTEHRSFKLSKGLHLEERKRERFLKARASINGQKHFLNTETTDFARAERLAVSWFRRLQADGTTVVPGPKTMHFVANSFLTDLQKPSTKLFHTAKWNAISDFFKAMDVDAVTTPVLKEFARWRRQRVERTKRHVGAHTLHKDYSTLRRILRHAVEEGWLNQLPLFPKQDKIVANPRPWLDPDEWQTLQRVAKERINEPELNARTKRQREELYDFCLMMVHSCCRVDELRNLRVRDCVVKQAKKRPYLEMRIQGKTGQRKGIAWSGAVSAFERLVKRGDLKSDDMLFAEHHRDGFTELLEAAGLRKDTYGNVRNLKSLRSTGLMMRIKANPRINLKLLSLSVGSSVAMLDTFYLKRLTVDMGVEELV